jgi:hypothetical protein
VEANTKLGRTEVVAEVRQGGEREAFLCAAKANVGHGLRAKPRDKKKVAALLLKHSEWGKCSAKEIAEMCGLSDKTVGKVKRRLESSAEIPRMDTVMVTRPNANGGISVYQQVREKKPRGRLPREQEGRTAKLNTVKQLPPEEAATLPALGPVVSVPTADLALHQLAAQPMAPAGSVDTGGLSPVVAEGWSLVAPTPAPEDSGPVVGPVAAAPEMATQIKDWAKAPLTPEYFIESGILFKVNREQFRPYGFNLTAHTGPDGNIWFRCEDRRTAPDKVAFDQATIDVEQQKFERFKVEFDQSRKCWQDGQSGKAKEW